MTNRVVIGFVVQMGQNRTLLYSTQPYPMYQGFSVWGDTGRSVMLIIHLVLYSELYPPITSSCLCGQIVILSEQQPWRMETKVSRFCVMATQTIAICVSGFILNSRLQKIKHGPLKHKISEYRYLNHECQCVKSTHKTCESAVKIFYVASHCPVRITLHTA
jgi:hypothetical protein